MHSSYHWLLALYTCRCICTLNTCRLRLSQARFNLLCTIANTYEQSNYFIKSYITVSPRKWIHKQNHTNYTSCIYSQYWMCISSHIDILRPLWHSQEGSGKRTLQLDWCSFPWHDHNLKFPLDTHQCLYNIICKRWLSWVNFMRDNYLSTMSKVKFTTCIPKTPWIQTTWRS